MFGLHNKPSLNERCERCKSLYQFGDQKHFAVFNECLFYQNYSTVYGAEICYRCLIFINSRLGSNKLALATISGLNGFLTTYDNRSAAVHVTLLIHSDGKYLPQFSN